MTSIAAATRTRRLGMGAAAWLAATGVALSAPPDSLSPYCRPAAGGGAAVSAQPTLLAALEDSFHEAWQGSPAVADLDAAGENEIVAARHGRVVGWHLDGTVVFSVDTNEGRIWSSPVVADLDPANPGLEVAAASRSKLFVWGANGTLRPGFPVTWRDELRSLAAGDIDGDAALELVVVTTSRLEANDQRDILMAYDSTGTAIAGFPPNTTGAAGCDAFCFVTGGFDQNLALGDLDGDGIADIVAPHDNAYLSVHRGDGEMFDAAAIFHPRTKVAGVRFLFDYETAQQGYPDQPATENQAHFTNSGPAIADLDGDGVKELAILGSAQNAAQTERERGVGLWLIRPDGTRVPGWEEPLHLAGYLAGLWDLGDNIVGATNQVAIADLDPPSASLEMVFAGFDGKIHAVESDRDVRWSYTYTTDPEVLTGGVALADLSGDGVPEVVFVTYSTDAGKSKLFVLGAGGALQRQVALPDRGAMPVPTIADVDRDGTLEIVVSLKDEGDDGEQVLVFTVTGSAANCLPWPTGRGNHLRNGASAFLPTPPVLFNDGFETGDAAWSATPPD